MSESKLRTQSLNFAVSIINLTKSLKAKHETIISNQIGRSGTSIGANIREAQYAHGTADFVAKFTRGNTWKDSHLRKWLNKDFLNIAFNEEERLKILDSEISLAGNNGVIQDKLFCLSIQEVGRYFHGPCIELRKAECTSYAKFNGAYRSPKGYS